MPPYFFKEIGTLRRYANGEVAFVGSSSGVFFVNVVRRAFAAAAPSPPSQEAPEDCILGENEQSEEETSNPNIDDSQNDTPQNERSRQDWPPTLDVNSFPDYNTAKQLARTYFQTWHPLLPFLHGPSFMQELEAFYSQPRSKPIQPRAERVRVITFQCIFNIAILDHPDLPSLKNCKIESSTQLVAALGVVALRRDTASVQALLAAQLFLIATMSLRIASTVGGLIVRSLVQAGLHRCPYRYAELSIDDREIRKRIFWSAYTLDRFLSQALGLPLGIQDDDFDLCLPGMHEKHEPVSVPKEPVAEGSPEETILHLPSDHPRRRNTVASPSRDIDRARLNLETRDKDSEYRERAGPENERRVSAETTSVISQRKQDRQAMLANFVQYAGLSGRVLEMFHKSILVRSTDKKTMLLLRADVDAWWNSIPADMQSCYTSHGDTSSVSASASKLFDLRAFFGVSYHNLLLLINRPLLSLDPSSAEFKLAIQTCIGAARTVISILKAQLEQRKALFWPGYISAVWMAGLMLAFASQLSLYSSSKASSEISTCLELLKAMTKRWKIAKHCCNVLSTLRASDHHNPISASDNTSDNNATRPSNVGTGSMIGNYAEKDSHATSSSKRRKVDRPAERFLPEGWRYSIPADHRSERQRYGLDRDLEAHSIHNSSPSLESGCTQAEGNVAVESSKAGVQPIQSSTDVTSSDRSASGTLAPDIQDASALRGRSDNVSHHSSSSFSYYGPNGPTMQGMESSIFQQSMAASANADIYDQFSGPGLLPNDFPPYPGAVQSPYIQMQGMHDIFEGASLESLLDLLGADMYT